MIFDRETIWTIVVAAGTGTRFGGSTPKQFVEVAGKRIVDWSLKAAAGVSAGVVVVMPSGSSINVSGHGLDCEVICVPGGESRSDSVRKGLAAVPASAQMILVHDAARPVASLGLFERVVEAIAAGADAAIPVVEVVDTIRTNNGDAVDRSNLQAVQTPQGFAASVLRAAHASGADATDDASLVQAGGVQVVAVEGDRWNLKMTEPEDEIVVVAVLEARR